MAASAGLGSLIVGSADAGASPSVTLTVAYWSGYNPAGTNIMPAWINAAAKDLQKTYPERQGRG